MPPQATPLAQSSTAVPQEGAWLKLEPASTLKQARTRRAKAKLLTPHSDRIRRHITNRPPYVLDHEWETQLDKDVTHYGNQTPYAGLGTTERLRRVALTMRRSPYHEWSQPPHEPTQQLNV